MEKVGKWTTTLNKPPLLRYKLQIVKFTIINSICRSKFNNFVTNQINLLNISTLATWIHELEATYKWHMKKSKMHWKKEHFGQAYLLQKLCFSREWRPLQHHGKIRHKMLFSMQYFQFASWWIDLIVHLQSMWWVLKQETPQQREDNRTRTS